MAWQSWTDFFHMGGYGLYVWGSYAVTFGALGVEVALAQRRRRQALVQAGAGEPA